MTAITHPLVSTHHLLTVLATAAVSVGLTVALMLAFTTTKSGTPISQVTRADPILCHQLANATPGSPAAFRLAETITGSGQSC
jgi:hypothetical protein